MVIDWTTVSAIVQALAALVIAALTFGLVRYARRQSQAASDAIEEVRRDRELAYRPWIAADWTLAATTYTLTLTNVGAGPAINVQVCIDEYLNEERGRRWWSGSVGDVAVQGKERRVAQPATDERSRRLSCLSSGLGAEAPDRDVPGVAVRFRDVMGTWYRTPGAPGESAPARWREGEEPRPGWTLCRSP